MKIKYNYRCCQPGYCVDNCLKDYLIGCKDCDKNDKQLEWERNLTEFQTNQAAKRNGHEIDDS